MPEVTKVEGLDEVPEGWTPESWVAFLRSEGRRCDPYVISRAHEYYDAAKRVEKDYGIVVKDDQGADRPGQSGGA
jgi:hypothetical protein